MSDKELNNTIFFFFFVTEYYKKAHSLTNEQFLELNSKYGILRFVSECLEIFDCMSEQEMVEEIDRYVANA